MAQVIWQTLLLGVKSLFLHKLRSALTVLGILIGVTAVIWLVAMGEGVSQQAQEQIKNLGATSIIVRSIKPAEQSSKEQARFLRYGLLREDFARLKGIPSVVEAVPMRELSAKVVQHDTHRHTSRIVGCTPDYMSINRLTVERGRFLSDSDIGAMENYAVLAHETAEQLFPSGDPLGKTVQVERDFYLIVGVTKEREQSAGIGGSLAAQDFNSDVYIPLSTLKARIGDQVMNSRAGSREGEIVELSQITLKVSGIDQVDSTAEQIRVLLEKFHPGKDFAITIPKELLRQAELLRLMFTALLVLIAGISLLVGGIGIMNIMLATVTERTREIGIRRALGAKRGHIMWQFLTETLVLTLVGGLLGVVLGLMVNPVVGGLQWMGSKGYKKLDYVGLNWLGNNIHDSYLALPETIRELHPVVAAWSIVASLLIAILVGVFFGMYPAWQAARMDPIEALRHE